MNQWAIMKTAISKIEQNEMDTNIIRDHSQYFIDTIGNNESSSGIFK